MRWPWNRPENPTVTSDTARIDALERRAAASEADAAALRREWADTLDKLQTWFGRQAARKRQQLHRELEKEHEEANTGNGAAPVSGVDPTDKAALRRVYAARKLGGQR